MSTTGNSHRAVHISTVHSALDPRIRLKQLRSIVQAGMDACLITADPTAKAEVDGYVDGVKVWRITSCRHTRLWRMAVLAPKAVLYALFTPASLYHIHDPELLPWAWLLLLRRVPIFYDVHEDYYTAMQKKFYLPRWSRLAVGQAVALFERIFSLPYHHIIAEYSYAKRFPRAVPILNYPLRSMLECGTSGGTGFTNSVSAAGNYRLLYTGYVTIERGALNLAKVVREITDVDITLVGRCFTNVARRMEEAAGGGSERLHIVGEGRYVPFHEIQTYYAKKAWTAGIVLIPDLTHFKEKHLTKFFEFMALGVPIIASHFPVWRHLIEEQGVGICVDPEDTQEVGEAIYWIARNPVKARQMGRRGQELINTYYNWESQARQLLSHYRRRLER